MKTYHLKINDGTCTTHTLAIEADHEEAFWQAIESLKIPYEVIVEASILEEGERCGSKRKPTTSKST